jgi:hypothetical protein
MFLRNLVRVTAVALLLIVCMIVLFLGPLLNIAGVLSVGWALLLLFSTVVLLVTTVITYGQRVAAWIALLYVVNR